MPWRAVYSQESLTLPGGYQHVRESIDLGEQARVFAELPLKLEIVDRKIAVAPLDLQHPDRGGTLIVRTSSLLDALHVLFELVWERATPLRPSAANGVTPEAGTPSPTPQWQQLIPLLAAGLKDDAITRQLGITTRTIERRMQSLMTDLDARTRFQAGWLAAQRERT